MFRLLLASISLAFSCAASADMNLPQADAGMAATAEADAQADYFNNVVLPVIRAEAEAAWEADPSFAKHMAEIAAQVDADLDRQAMGMGMEKGDAK